MLCRLDAFGISRVKGMKPLLSWSLTPSWGSQTSKNILSCWKVIKAEEGYIRARGTEREGGVEVVSYGKVYEKSIQ